MSQKEFGDFQTPPALADAVCARIRSLGVRPDTIIEPTCGRGAFVEASARAFSDAAKIIGVEISAPYLQDAQVQVERGHYPQEIELVQGDFFTFDWEQLAKTIFGVPLILGNLPWVTNSEQEKARSTNLPQKSNFSNYKGLDALTGKSNFDISEWMLLRLADAFMNREGYLAILCKAATARKFLNHLRRRKAPLMQAALYGIPAKAHFGASVEACLLFCRFGSGRSDFDYKVYASLDADSFTVVGHRFGMPVRDLAGFDSLAELNSGRAGAWRSGVKHDCADVLELSSVDGHLANGLGQTVDVEADCLFPLLKGSDVANGRVAATDKLLLLPQRQMGDPTDHLAIDAPKTWRYLESHRSVFEKRKSRVFHGRPKFAVFGVGSYTFAPWKVAICGLYKNLNFRVVGPIAGKPVVFDDTVYFLSFPTIEQAQEAYELLMSPQAQGFLQSLIFWDEKRPVKASVLNCLDLDVLRSRVMGVPQLQPPLLHDQFAD